MKRLLLCFIVFVFVFSLVSARAQLTFYLVDNFEDGTISKWYVFDKIKAEVFDNPAKDERDSVGEASGEKSLRILGHAESWYAGGMGTILDVDGSEYSRFLLDVYGSKNRGKIKIELFEKRTAASTDEVKWIAELPVLGPGFTRFSIPFSAFSLDDPKKLVFHGKQGGRISKFQLIFVASSDKGDIDLAVDNLIFTF